MGLFTILRLRHGRRFHDTLLVLFASSSTDLYSLIWGLLSVVVLHLLMTLHHLKIVIHPLRLELVELLQKYGINETWLRSKHRIRLSHLTRNTSSWRTSGTACAISNQIQLIHFLFYFSDWGSGSCRIVNLLQWYLLFDIGFRWCLLIGTRGRLICCGASYGSKSWRGQARITGLETVIVIIVLFCPVNILLWSSTHSLTKRCLQDITSSRGSCRICEVLYRLPSASDRCWLYKLILYWLGRLLLRLSSWLEIELETGLSSHQLLLLLLLLLRSVMKISREEIGKGKIRGLGSRCGSTSKELLALRRVMSVIFLLAIYKRKILRHLNLWLRKIPLCLGCQN